MIRGTKRKMESKVIPFKQDGAFYYKRARKYMNSSNYYDALSFYSRAVELEPDNTDYLLDLAEAFTETDHFEESNQILLSLIQKGEEISECFFGLGCNFMGLQEFNKAQESFLKYLQVEPDGLYSEDANEILDMIENEAMFGELDEADEDMGAFASALQNGKDFLDKRNYKRASALLETALEIAPKSPVVKNNLSLSYFMLGERDQAIEVALSVLADDPGNLHANCNLALFYKEAGDIENCSLFGDKLVKLEAGTPEELSKICVTLYELGRYSDAYKRLKILSAYMPYDKSTLHAMAVSCFNLERYAEAVRLWEKIEKLDMNDSISPYYRKIAIAEMERREEGAERTKPEISYAYQVPQEEMLQRIKNVNELLRKNLNLSEVWQADEEFRKLILWAMNLDDPMIKRAMMHLVGTFADARAERILRNFLLRRSEPDALKKEAFGILKQMWAKEPYIAYLEGDIVEVRVSMVPGLDGELNDDCRKLLELALQGMRGRYPDSYIEQVTRTWEKVFADNGKPAKITSPRAWAAALEFIYCREEGLDITKSELIKLYHTSLQTLNKAIAALSGALKEDDGAHED